MYSTKSKFKSVNFNTKSNLFLDEILKNEIKEKSKNKALGISIKKDELSTRNQNSSKNIQYTNNQSTNSISNKDNSNNYNKSTKKNNSSTKSPMLDIKEEYSPSLTQILSPTSKYINNKSKDLSALYKKLN